MVVSLYFDDDCAGRAVVRGLRERGVDVQTSDEAGNRGAPDDVYFAFASQSRRVLVTANQVDFMRLHARALRAGSGHSGLIIVGQQRWDIGEQVRRFARVAAQRTESEMRDSVEFLSQWGEP